MIDLDDDEEEEMADLTGVEYSKDIWWCQNAEQFEEYKEWEAAVDRQEVNFRNNRFHWVCVYVICSLSLRAWSGRGLKVSVGYNNVPG